MAKEKEGDQEVPRPPKSGTTRTARERAKPEKTGSDDLQEINDSGGDGGRPDWWRGDPGKRGEVL